MIDSVNNDRVRCLIKQGSLLANVSLGLLARLLRLFTLRNVIKINSQTIFQRIDVYLEPPVQRSVEDFKFHGGVFDERPTAFTIEDRSYCLLEFFPDHLAQKVAARAT